ncbi:Metallo-dependent phosphatase-like protein [Aspergillus floccosus]
MSAVSSLPGASSYIAPPGFPTAAFLSYYYSPAKPTAEPQPIIHDPVLGFDFPLNLTDPNTIPQEKHDPSVFPDPIFHLPDHEQRALVRSVKVNVTRVIEESSSSNCAKCKEALAAAKPAALYAPTLVPEAIIFLCKQFRFQEDPSCEETYAASAFGAIWTQVLAYADVQGPDGNYICNSLNKKFCDMPSTTPLDTSNLFPKPKPANPRVPKPSGERIKVAHLSDIHLDPRYAVNAEANCTKAKSCCCRANLFNSASQDTVLVPASAYGEFRCDSPYDLTLAALQAVGPLTGTGKSPDQDKLAFTLYTGDMLAHDEPQTQIDRAYLAYAETSVTDMLKTYLTGPVFATLGNHDSSPKNMDAPHGLPGAAGQQYSWNYDYVAGLWQHEGWLDNAAAAAARAHYGGYSVKTSYGLRIISINTDFWYAQNFLALVNTTNPDVSGTLAWLIAELQRAEDAAERVWIIGHVPSGWDGIVVLPNPTDLFYQIVERYSPHVIANIFFGHTHEDEFHLYYANNGTVPTLWTALATAWIGPSITPNMNLNSGFRMYEVDTGDFNVYEAYTFFSNVSEFGELRETGPVWRVEYSTRETYGPAASWPPNSPLNATFWHRVTEGMERDGNLVTLFNVLQGRRSVNGPQCTSARCREAKVCYMRSGSAALARGCTPGFGSVQAPFWG